jgi:hypothetical protein
VGRLAAGAVVPVARAPQAALRFYRGKARSGSCGSGGAGARDARVRVDALRCACAGGAWRATMPERVERWVVRIRTAPARLAKVAAWAPPPAGCTDASGARVVPEFWGASRARARARVASRSGYNPCGRDSAASRANRSMMSASGTGMCTGGGQGRALAPPTAARRRAFRLGRAPWLLARRARTFGRRRRSAEAAGAGRGVGISRECRTSTEA